MNKIEQIQQDIENGEITPLQGYVLLKQFIRVAETACELVKELAIAEVQESGQTSVEVGGMNVQLTKSAGRWDYSNVPEYQQMKDDLKTLQTVAQETGKAFYHEGTPTIAVKSL